MSTAPAISPAQRREIDAIIAVSLHSFYEDMSTNWRGRENELVNLYAFGHLAKHVAPGTILSDLTQIGIEVTVRQLPPEVLCSFHKNKAKPKGDVRKDLVIWPSARMNLWSPSSAETVSSHNTPLAVIEWKVNHWRNIDAHTKNRRDYIGDITWLRETSTQPGMETFVGYAIMVEQAQAPQVLTCVRVRSGKPYLFLASVAGRLKEWGA